jgi:pSer/pThr/pTyr-binding forkhead associated (FHA) protein
MPGGQPPKQGVPMRPTMDTDPMGRAAIPQASSPYAPFQQSASAMPTPSIPHMAGTVPTLYLIFNGQRIPITKEQFIIGRGLKTSDLAIKDGNISRKHAAIIYHNGAYYIKDLGSVNGIEFAGKRIDSKRIDEADVFHICDYELRFTYK